MQLGTPAQRASVRTAIEQGDTQMLDEVASIVKSTGALDIAMESAAREIHRAIQFAQQLPWGQHTSAMVDLATRSLIRTH